MIRTNYEITDERGRIKTGVMREWGGGAPGSIS